MQTPYTCFMKIFQIFEIPEASIGAPFHLFLCPSDAA